MGNTIRVKAGRGYDIIVERGIIHKTGMLVRDISKSSKAAVITDSNVGRLYAQEVIESLKASGFEVCLFTFSAGETSKNHETLAEIYSFLVKNGVTRSDLIIALGGGVTGDMAGYAAATYMRGIDFVQIPTSLLAQIDSSVGGKTGVDLPEGKNLVGAFWQPRLVICDPDTLQTLPERFLTDGMAEAVKYGCIVDKKLFDLMKFCDCIDNIMEDMICFCIAIKRDIVERDERERGERMLLNFGHTLGHAIEKLYQYKSFTHGEGVAVGMILAAEAGERAGLTQPGTANEIKSILNKFHLPISCDLTVKEMTKTALSDKKRSGDTIGLVLLRKIGDSFIYRIPVTELEFFFSGGTTV